MEIQEVSKSSSTGKPFVFQARARLNLVVQVAPDDPKLLHITATLLDPQGNPFRNQRVTFEAEFPDAIFVPLNSLPRLKLLPALTDQALATLLAVPTVEQPLPMIMAKPKSPSLPSSGHLTAPEQS